MRKPAAAMAALMICTATLCAAQGATAWQKFEPAGEGFSVLMPTAPTSETKVNPANERMKVRFHSSVGEGLSFYVAALDYRGLFSQSAAGFDSFAEGFLKSYCEPVRQRGMTCEPSYERAVTLGGYTGKQYRVAVTADGRRVDSVLRMYMTASHVYAFNAIGGKEGDAPVDKFLNSFAITTAGAAKQ